MDLLEEAKRIQVSRGISNSQMAKLLGYNQRQNWVRIKGGRSLAGRPFQLRFLKAFPEFASVPSKTSQDGKRGALKSFLDKIVLKVKKFG